MSPYSGLTSWSQLCPVSLQELLAPAVLHWALRRHGRGQNPALPPFLLLGGTFLVCGLPMSPLQLRFAFLFFEKNTTILIFTL